ncbi:MAG: hypothetical protein V2A63_01760 [Patescibacteria group bacterium]
MFFLKPSPAKIQNQIEKLHVHTHQKKNFFPGQRESEEVQLSIRMHWLQRARIFMWFLILGVASPGIIFIFFEYVRLPENYQIVLNLVIIFYFLMAWLLTLIEFIKSEFTIVVVTNERVVDITQKSIFDWQIAETNLDRIQEVGGQTHGFWLTFFNVGQLEIQTAGSDIPLLMNFVKSPQMTARKILDVQKASQSRRRTSDFGKRESDQVQRRAGENFAEEELRQMRKKIDSESGRKSGDSL